MCDTSVIQISPEHLNTEVSPFIRKTCSRGHKESQQHPDVFSCSSLISIPFLTSSLPSDCCFRCMNTPGFHLRDVGAEIEKQDAWSESSRNKFGSEEAEKWTIEMTWQIKLIHVMTESSTWPFVSSTSAKEGISREDLWPHLSAVKNCSIDWLYYCFDLRNNLTFGQKHVCL